MRSLTHLLASAAIGGVAALACATSADAQAGTDVRVSYAAPGAGVVVARHPKTGLVTWLSGDEERPVARASSLGGAVGPEQAAVSFLSGQSAAFGLRDAGAELSTTRISSDEAGRDFVRFQQKHQGIPILGAELNVQLDGARNVLSVNGRTVGDLGVSTQPSVSAGDASKLAVASAAKARGVAPSALIGAEPVLAVHDPRIFGGPAAPPALVWRVDVRSTSGPDVSEFVLINAENGRVAVQFSNLKHAGPPPNAQQWVCDAANTVSKFPCTAGAIESNPGGSATADVKNAFDYAEATYDFYARRFGRNSLDGKGLRLVSTVRYRANPAQDLANAFWNEDLQQMVYGKDYASGKDVVGHELTHGVTTYTSGLFYYYQSGSINESMSDVFGELIQRSVDGTRLWLLGEELPIGAIRNMKNPPEFNDPDKMTSALWTGDFGNTDAGGVHTNSGVGNKAAYLITDGGTFNGKKVKGLGLDKAAALYYRVNAFLLQSSSDYADLGNALNQACADLVGKKPKDKVGKPTKAFAKKDCVQVAAAVTATEMLKQPQFWPIPAEAAVCKSNQTPTGKFYERFEATDPSKFKLQPSDARWELVDFYAASNSHAQYLFGTGQFESSLATPAGVKIPEKAFLRFAHFYQLQADSVQNYAGGVVEYSESDGVWKTVPASMFLDNPYNATLAANTGNVLAGQPAFSNFSGGWTSSRIDLKSLAGKTLKFRFRVGTDFRGSGTGWIIDDVRIYACKTAKRDLASAE